MTSQTLFPPSSRPRFARPYPGGPNYAAESTHIPNGLKGRSTVQFSEGLKGQIC